MPVSGTNAAAIELKDICKSFGSVVANHNINLTVKQGEILALLGENGSGKTTLMNILSGIYLPDSGSITVRGQHAVIKSPEDSTNLKIGMVHQHFKLIDVFSAADNIIMGSRKEHAFLSNKRYGLVRKIGAEFGFDINPNKKVYEMSVSEKQTVEILKVLYRGAEILILDEPTAVLTPHEIKKLFEILRQMKKAGCAVVIITHKLNEVLEISDRVTVLRKGESIATVQTSQTNAKELTELMVGRSVELSIDRPECTQDENLLSVYKLKIENNEGVETIKDVSFEINKGEILGVAGIAGSGQKELCEAIAGLQKIKGGAILYKNQNIEGKTPREIINMGISMSFIPEDRLGMGLVASMSVADNMLLKTYPHSARAFNPFISRKPSRSLAERLVRELEISTPSIDTPVRRLSGGNVQKVLLGREIEARPNVLITAYPVRGLDINSSYMIYHALNEQKKNGIGILFIGEDLDVMLELCDRILVLYHGGVAGIVNAKTTKKEQIGLMMTGAGKEDTIG